MAYFTVHRRFKVVCSLEVVANLAVFRARLYTKFQNLKMHYKTIIVHQGMGLQDSPLLEDVCAAQLDELALQRGLLPPLTDHDQHLQLGRPLQILPHRRMG